MLQEEGERIKMTKQNSDAGWSALCYIATALLFGGSLIYGIGKQISENPLNNAIYEVRKAQAEQFNARYGSATSVSNSTNYAQSSLTETNSLGTNLNARAKPVQLEGVTNSASETYDATNSCRRVLGGDKDMNINVFPQMIPVIF